MGPDDSIRLAAQSMTWEMFSAPIFLWRLCDYYNYDYIVWRPKIKVVGQHVTDRQAGRQGVIAAHGTSLAAPGSNCKCQNACAKVGLCFTLDMLSFPRENQLPPPFLNPKP